MAGILAAGAAPAIIRTPGLLMPVRKIIVPELRFPDYAINGHYSGIITSDLARKLYAKALWKACRESPRIGRILTLRP